MEEDEDDGEEGEDYAVAEVEEVAAWHFWWARLSYSGVPSSWLASINVVHMLLLGDSETLIPSKLNTRFHSIKDITTSIR